MKADKPKCSKPTSLGGPIMKDIKRAPLKKHIKLLLLVLKESILKPYKVSRIRYDSNKGKYVAM